MSPTCTWIKIDLTWWACYWHVGYGTCAFFCMMCILVRVIFINNCIYFFSTISCRFSRPIIKILSLRYMVYIILRNMCPTKLVGYDVSDRFRPKYVGDNEIFRSVLVRDWLRCWQNLFQFIKYIICLGRSPWLLKQFESVEWHYLYLFPCQECAKDLVILIDKCKSFGPQLKYTHNNNNGFN